MFSSPPPVLHSLGKSIYDEQAIIGFVRFRANTSFPLCGLQYPYCMFSDRIYCVGQTLFGQSCSGRGKSIRIGKVGNSPQSPFLGKATAMNDSLPEGCRMPVRKSGWFTGNEAYLLIIKRPITRSRNIVAPNLPRQREQIGGRAGGNFRLVERERAYTPGGVYFRLSFIYL